MSKYVEKTIKRVVKILQFKFTAKTLYAMIGTNITETSNSSKLCL